MTDQPKWTPGPWRAVMGSRHVVDVFAGDRDVVSVYGGGGGFEYRDANAHLIAAAPDMADVLAEVAASLHQAARDRDLSEGELAFMRRVDAALAKARGRA